MKKLTILPLAALALAACSETPTAPAVAPQYNHGGSHSLHDLQTPVLAAPTVNGTSVTLSWSPTFAAAQADCDAMADANTVDLATTCWGVHFEIYRNSVKLDDVATNGFSDGPLAPGTYVYTVKVKGNEGSVFTHHSRESNSQTVVIAADVYLFTPVEMPAGNPLVSGGGYIFTNKNAGTYTFWAKLSKNGVDVTDCTTVDPSTVSVVATFTSPVAGTSGATATNCAYHGNPGEWAYEFAVANLAQKQVPLGTFAFTVGSAAAGTINFTAQ